MAGCFSETPSHLPSLPFSILLTRVLSQGRPTSRKRDTSDERSRGGTTGNRRAGRPREPLSLGHEQRGVRPCIAVSDPSVSADQPFPLIAIVTATATVGVGALHPGLSPGASGLTKTSCPLVDHLRSIDKRSIRRTIGQVSSSELFGIDQGLDLFLGLSAGPWRTPARLGHETHESRGEHFATRRPVSTVRRGCSRRPRHRRAAWSHQDEARLRLARDGRNELTASALAPAWRKSLAHVEDALVILVLVATALSAGLCMSATRRCPTRRLPLALWSSSTRWWATF